MTPGSYQAVQLGCLCPLHQSYGTLYNGGYQWLINDACPVHGAIAAWNTRTDLAPAVCKESLQRDSGKDDAADDLASAREVLLAMDVLVADLRAELTARDTLIDLAEKALEEFMGKRDLYGAAYSACLTQEDIRAVIALEQALAAIAKHRSG